MLSVLQRGTAWLLSQRMLKCPSLSLTLSLDLGFQERAKHCLSWVPLHCLPSATVCSATSPLVVRHVWITRPFMSRNGMRPPLTDPNMGAGVPIFWSKHALLVVQRKGGLVMNVVVRSHPRKGRHTHIHTHRHKRIYARTIYITHALALYLCECARARDQMKTGRAAQQTRDS